MAADDISPERAADGTPIWTVAGYSDWSGDYHDFSDVDFTKEGDWYPQADLVTISWQDVDNGNTQYARIVGNFEDLEDLTDRVETYFEEGSP